jgi:transposase
LPLGASITMKRLPVIAHLSADEVGRRHRRRPDPKEKTRWHLVWLLLRPDEPLRCERAGPLVGVSDAHARTVLKRRNAHGPDGLSDRRKANRSPGKPSDARQAEVFEALKAEPPDGGLWSGPKLARYARERWGVEVCPETGWRWLKKLGFRLVVPRPRHPKAAGPDEQRRRL